MSDKKISQLTLKAVPTTADVLPIVDSTAADNKKITIGTIPVSTPVQDALDLKADISGQVFTGSISATNLSGTNTGDETTITIKTKLGAATALADGYLTSTDWSTFNSKEPALTKGNLTEATSSVLTISGGTGSVIGSGTTIQVKQASNTQSGYVTSSDYAKIQSAMLYDKSIAVVQAVVANTTPSVLGCATPSVTGTASAVTPAGTSIYTYKKILEYTATAISTAIAGWRFITETLLLGTTSAFGGFRFSTGFGFVQGFVTGGTNRRFFVGFTSSTTAPTDVNPSTLTDMFGFGMDNGDTTIQFMHNDGSGAATKVSTGLARPTADKSTFYKAELSAVAGAGSVSYKITDLGTGTSFEGTVNTDLPAGNVSLSPRGWMSAGGVSSAVGIAMEHIYLEN